MLNLLEFAFTGPVVVYTILLMVALVYWLLVFIGALDLGAVDVDIDMDVDVDVDIDVDVDVDTDVDVDSSGGSVFLMALKYFNFGALPFMLLFSFLALFMWVQAMLANIYFSNGAVWFPIALIFPILFIGLILTKLVTAPLVKHFGNMDKEEKEIDFVGKTGTVVLPVSLKNTGQMELYEKGRFFTFQIKLAEGITEKIGMNKKVIITGVNEDNTVFYVEEVKEVDL